MQAQGRCVLPADEAGRVLDRLAGLEKVISPEAVRQACSATGRVNGRACKLPHEVMLWVVLAMGLLTDLPIAQVFAHARRMRLSALGKASATGSDPRRSALCQARQRLGVAPVRHLFEQVVRPLAQAEVPGGFYRGLRLMAFDSTVNDTPDTPANERAFGRPRGGDRGDGAFPQIRKLSLVELGTHVELAFQIKPCRTSEQTMLAPLLRHLTSQMLLLLDRGFFSYSLWKTLAERGVKLLVRGKQNLKLEPLRRLADGSYIAKIYASDKDRRHDRQGIEVRVIKYSLDDPQRTGHGETHVLLTNLLDAEQMPAQELIVLYHERWEEELVFDEQKTHQDPRRPTKPAHLRSETPAGVVQEVYALSLAHFVLRSLMFAAAEKTALDPDRLSFTGCFHVLQCRLPECESCSDATLQHWYECLLEELADQRLPPRANRINPRVIKRKMSKWPKKRPHHRRPTGLRKTFAETVFMES